MTQTRLDRPEDVGEYLEQRLGVKEWEASYPEDLCQSKRKDVAHDQAKPNRKSPVRAKPSNLNWLVSFKSELDPEEIRAKFANACPDVLHLQRYLRCSVVDEEQDSQQD